MVPSRIATLRSHWTVELGAVSIVVGKMEDESWMESETQSSDTSPKV